MHWLRGLSYVGVVTLLYGWGVRALLTVASTQGEGRALDARWLQKREASQELGGRERIFTLMATLVYPMLTLVLGGALGWVLWGFVGK